MWFKGLASGSDRERERGERKRVWFGVDWICGRIRRKRWEVVIVAGVVARAMLCDVVLCDVVV